MSLCISILFTFPRYCVSTHVPLLLHYFCIFRSVLLHYYNFWPFFLYFSPSSRYAMSTRFPFMPHLSIFLTFPYYSLNTRFLFLVVFLCCSYFRAIPWAYFFLSSLFLFPLLQTMWRAWILARHLSFLLQPVNRVLCTFVTLFKFCSCRQ